MFQFPLNLELCNNAHLGLHFPKILRNSKKIKGAMYYNITMFFHNLLSHLPDKAENIWIW